MNLTDLINAFYEKSEFTNPSELANYTKQTQPTTAAFLKGDKQVRQKENVLFAAITSGISVAEIIAAIELIRSVKLAEIERQQIL